MRGHYSPALRIALAASFGAFVAACAQVPERKSSETTLPSPFEQAMAVLHPTAEHRASGHLEFRREGASVRVNVEVKGLQPGEHGIHIHEWGDCSAPDAASAGGHLNPFGAPHGARNAEQRHVGDLGNITADATGEADASFMDSRIAVKGEALEEAVSIVGRSVIVHGGRDDLTSQPSGSSGARVACGVIGLSNARPSASELLHD